MTYVIDCGVVYELTRTQYKKLLKEISKGNPYNVSTYGSQLGHALNLSDLTADSAQERLRKMGCNDSE